MSGYFGVDGDSNTACIVKQSEDSRRNLKSITSDSIDCGIDASICGQYMMTCIDGFCQSISKTCVNDCYNHGTCLYQHISTKEQLSSCFLEEVTCESYCSCDESYGGQYCDELTHEIVNKQNLRQSLISNLLSVIATEDPDETSIMSWINNVKAICVHYDELSLDSIRDVLSIVTTILQYSSSSSVSISHESLQDLDIVLSVLLNVVEYNSGVNITNTFDIISDIKSAVVKLGNVMASDMVIGEDPIETYSSALRTTTHIQYSSQNMTLSSPKSSLEEYLSIRTHYVNILSSDNSSETSAYRSVTMVVTPVSLYGNRSLLSDAISLQVTTSESSNSGNGYKSLVYMQTNEVVNINNGEAVYVTTECAKDEISTKFVSGCPDINNEDIVVMCNGTAASIFTLCPQKQIVAACVQLQSSTAQSHAKCVLHSSSADDITCMCDVTSTVDDRRLLESNDGDDYYYYHSNSNSKGVTVDISTMLSTVSTDFTSNWKSAGDLSTSDVVRSYDVLVTMGVLFATILYAMIFSWRKDHEVKVEVMEDAKAINHRLSITKVIRKSKVPSDVQSIESALPAAFASAPFSERFVTENKKFHRWFGIIFYFSPHFPRVLRVVSLSTAVVTMLFIQAVTYNIAEADDGSCELCQDRTTCLAEPSSLARSQSKCYWDTDQQACYFNEPSNDLLRVVFVAIISAMWSAPISVFVEWIIMRVLAAKSHQATVDVSHEVMLTGIGINQRMSNTLSHAFNKTVNEEISDLSSEIKQYYETLTGEEKQEFAGMNIRG
jgi:hypothetical protein